VYVHVQCRGFTPVLGQKYQELKDAGKNIEIVFVSSDSDQASFDSYHGSQPWLALPFTERTKKEALSQAHGVRGIPCLVIVDGKTGEVITTEGRAAVSSSNYIENYPWRPKPMYDFSESLSGINDKASLVIAMEAADKKTQGDLSTMLNTLAIAELTKASANQRVNRFFTACGGGPTSQIRKGCGLPSLPPPRHQHELNSQDDSGNFGCDGCGANGKGKGRFRCTAGCDFDYCTSCNTAAENPDIPADSKLPVMLILNLSDQGAYYKPDDAQAEVSEANVEAFMTAFKQGSLPRQQFSRG
jgi:hypothetical protein